MSLCLIYSLRRISRTSGFGSGILIHRNGHIGICRRGDGVLRIRHRRSEGIDGAHVAGNDGGELGAGGAVRGLEVILAVRVDATDDALGNGPGDGRLCIAVDLIVVGEPESDWPCC